MEVPDISLFESFKLWGWIVMIVCVIAFLAVLGLSFIIPAVSLALIGVAIVFVGGFAIQIYGSIGIWLSRRSTASRTSARRRAERI